MPSLAAFTEDRHPPHHHHIHTHKPTLHLEKHAHTMDRWHPSPFPAPRGADLDGIVPQDTLNSWRNNGTSVPTEKQICVWREQRCFPTWGFHLVVCCLLMICALCHAAGNKGQRQSAVKVFIHCLPRRAPLNSQPLIAACVGLRRFPTSLRMMKTLSLNGNFFPSFPR